MNISEVLVMWTPDTAKEPAGTRGNFAVVRDHRYARAGVEKFKFVSGAVDPRSGDSRFSVRAEFVAELACTLVERDRLPAPLVLEAMLGISEFAEAFRQQLEDARLARMGAR
ncbi:MAG: hypothetical protein ABSF86_23485 [Steroidobacteraceae bacterium]|jgi:hypothetical protein